MENGEWRVESGEWRMENGIIYICEMVRKNLLNGLLVFLLFCGGLNGVFAQADKGLVIGGAKSDKGVGIIRDSEDNIVIAGTSRSYGNSSDDFIIIKMSLEGEIEYQKLFKWEHHGRVHDIEEASDGNYLLFGEVWDGGYGREDMYLMKVNKRGDKIWEQYYGGYHTDQGFSVKQLAWGFIALGYTSSQPGTTRGNFYLVKTDPDGGKIWENNYGTEFLDFGFSVLPDNNENYWLLGAAGGFYNPARADYMNHDSDMLLIITDPGGNELQRREFGGILHDWGKAMVRTGDGGAYLLGSTQSFGSGSFDMYLVKVDNLGNKIWENTYGDTEFEYGEAIVFDEEGNLLLLGTKQMPDMDMGPDMYVVKTDPMGNMIWEQTLGGPGSDYAFDLISLADTGCMIVGEIEDLDKSDTDIYVARLNKDGVIMGIGETDHVIGTDAVSFFPNPVSGQASIEWKSTPPPGGYKILIFSTGGQLVQSKEYENQPKIELELGNLPQGTYIYQVLYNNKSLTGKFITR
jgi:hypothetical protein